MDRLRAAIVTALTLWLFSIATNAAPPPPAPTASGPSSNALSNAADRTRVFESRYGITLVTQPPVPSKTQPNLRLTPLPPGPHRNVEQHLRILDEELARYSRGLLQASGVRRIALVQSVNNRNEVGLAHVDYAAGVLYWSLGYDSEDAYLRHAVHHEFFHAIDLRLHDHLAKDDPAWVVLNDRNFKYGPGGHIVREGFKPDHSDASPGFVSRYARTGAMEDKAETFAKLMQPEAAAWLEQQSARDGVVAAKVKYLRNLIEYHDRVNPDDETVKLFEHFMELVRRDEGREVEQFLNEHAGGDVLKARGYAGRTTLQRVIMARVTYAPQTYLFHARADRAIDVTAADEHGWTALHTAAWLRDVRSVGSLLARGADAAAKDKQGGTAADWARLRGYGDVIAAIEKHQRGSWKLTPEERAARAHAQRNQERERERQQEQLREQLQEQHLRQR